MFQTTEAMEEVARALALIADTRRDDQKAEGLEAGGQDDVMMTSQGTLMVESIAVDGSQQVRGADDVRVSNGQSVQGFGGRVYGGATEDVKSNEDTKVAITTEEEGKPRPKYWERMTKGQKKNWKKWHKWNGQYES